MSDSTDYRAISALCLVTIQLGLQPFLTELFIPPNGIKSTIVILQEIIKSFCCLFVLYSTGNLWNVLTKWTFSNSLKVALIPAIIYSTQNILAFYAYLNLDPLTFNLINQSKMIFGAIFLKLILNKTPTKTQIVALLILFTSSIILTFDTYKSSQIDVFELNIDSNKQPINGLIAVMIASILSGIAGTLTQKALQKEKLPRNSLLFSTELAFYGNLFAFFRLYIENIFDVFDGGLIAKYGFLYNLQLSVLIAVTINAIGGIGIGLIIKYTSIIYKNYAFIGGILLSGIFRSFLYPKPMSFAMYISLPLVIISLWLNIDRSSKSKNKRSSLKKHQ